jgi:hypothetical protein
MPVRHVVFAGFLFILIASVAGPHRTVGFISTSIPSLHGTSPALAEDPKFPGNPVFSRSRDLSAAVTTANACSIDTLIWVSSGGCYTTIPAAITAATNGGTTAGTVIVPAGNYPIGSTLALGNEAAPVTMYLMDGAKLTCTMTNGTDCIEIPSDALLRGANWGWGLSTAPSSGVYCGTSAVLTSLVTNMSHTGSGDGSGGLQNIYLSCIAPNVTVTQGVLWWQMVSTNWADENVSILSSASAPARLWTNPATSFVGYIGPLYVENPQVDCLASGCVPFEATGYVTPMLVAGGDINYHPGLAASGDVVVLSTAGSATSGPYGVTFMNTHFEAQTSGDFFYLNGVGDVDFHEVSLDSISSITAANCLHIVDAAGTPGPIKFSGHMALGTCTDAVTNASSGGTIALSSLYQGDIDYVYGGAGSGTSTLFVDGRLDCLRPSGCFFDASTVIKQGSASGTDYTTNSTSFEQVDATNLLYTATVPLGTKVKITAIGTAAVSIPHQYCTVGIGIDGIVVNAQQYQSAGAGLPSQGVVTVDWVFVGDGNSHTFDLRFESNSGGNTASLINGSNVFPTMVFEMYPSK